MKKQLAFAKGQKKKKRQYAGHTHNVEAEAEAVWMQLPLGVCPSLTFTEHLGQFSALSNHLHLILTIIWGEKLILSPSYRWPNWGFQRLGNSLKVTGLNQTD